VLNIINGTTDTYSVRCRKKKKSRSRKSGFLLIYSDRPLQGPGRKFGELRSEQVFDVNSTVQVLFIFEGKRYHYPTLLVNRINLISVNKSRDI
jgi:hypothetical protein